jgi:O-antigen/teichoic acid export membrane protein
VAAFYGDDRLRWLIPAVGLSAILGGFESTSMHTLQRKLRLERLTLLDLTGQTVSIIAIIILALADRAIYGPSHPGAVWAIVIGSLVASTVRLVLSHTYLPGIRHRFHLDREHARHLFSFGRWIFVSTLLTFLAAQSDRLVFGKTIPLSLFGVYSIASMIAVLPTNAILKLGGAVVFPTYSRLVQRPDFGHLFVRVRMPLLLGGGAIASTLLACGPPLVRMLYDPRYVEAGWILQYLSATAWFQILECTNGAALLALGRVKWVAAGNAAKVAGMVALIPLGFHFGGFSGALIGLAGSDLAKYLTVALGAAVAGLSGFAGDMLLTALVGGTSALGIAAGRLVAPRGPALAAVAVSVAAAALPWAAVALYYLTTQRRRARSEMLLGSPVKSHAD